MRTAQDALRVVEAQYKVGLVARDKVREAEAALAEAQASLYGTRCQYAAVLATWRYLTGRPVAMF
ncbi:outer membrane efflux protein [Thermodesulfitimonas autotrophica]|uniref:Outer membrane efflux protein n=1 Tax=Thermodesulfitimonas autotrophica TaxID=1894989 RepID=A0A3N5AAN4_9THEO|nr:TolC family protein [Thermodesulfitimonas autotrophica]RPF42659.1 outer membrane efflux protein [Thermodesulfitimonas autotrophica]